MGGRTGKKSSAKKKPINKKNMKNVRGGVFDVFVEVSSTGPKKRTRTLVGDDNK